MAKLIWGNNGQLNFKDEREYFCSLGLLCKKNAFNIVYEHNKLTNSWEDAYRIQCPAYLIGILTDAFKNALRTQNRINNNEYIKNLIDNHNFEYTGNGKYIIGDYLKVINTVPTQYRSDFTAGYNR